MLGDAMAGAGDEHLMGANIPNADLVGAPHGDMRTGPSVCDQRNEARPAGGGIGELLLARLERNFIRRSEGGRSGKEQQWCEEAAHHAQSAGAAERGLKLI